MLIEVFFVQTFPVTFAQMLFLSLTTFGVGAFFFYLTGKLRGRLDGRKEMRRDMEYLKNELERCRRIISEEGDGWKL